MAKKEIQQYWLGRGVIHINGKEYGAGDPLPVDKMDKKTLENQKKKGNIGEKIAPVGANDLETVNANLVEQLEEAQKANADLTKQLEEVTEQLEEATKPPKDK